MKDTVKRMIQSLVIWHQMKWIHMQILGVPVRIGESYGIQVKYVKCHPSCRRMMLSMKFLSQVVVPYGLLLLQVRIISSSETSSFTLVKYSQTPY